MPSFNNYTFTNIQYTIPEGDNVSVLYPTAQITIIPNSGYTATAADFSLDSSFSDNAVQSVVFTQDGLNVLCTITFDIGFVMPSGNYTIPLCVVGEGTVVNINVAGQVYSSVGENISGDGPETGTAFSNSGSLGQTELLLTRTYNADAGYYWETSNYPTINITQGNQANYNIVQTPTYTGDDLTGISYAVNYTYPNQDNLTERIAINVPNASLVYVAPGYITSYSNLPSTVGGEGNQNVTWYVYGNEGAAVTATIVGLNYGYSATIINNETIGSTGIITAEILFPDLYGSCSGYCNEVYTITLTGDLDPAFVRPNPITIYQTTVSPKIEFTGSSTNGITGYTPVITERSAYTRIAEESNLITIEWDISTPNGLLQYPNTVDTTTITNMDSVLSAKNTSTITNSTSLDLNFTTGLAIGDKFNLPTTSFEGNDSGYSPFQYEVTAVNSSTNITISPAISMIEGNRIVFWRNNGNVSDINNISYTPTTDSSGKLTLVFDVTGYGNADSTFIVDLDTLFNFVPDIACGSTAISGGEGVTDYSLDLDPAGGLVAFLVNGQGLPDKFEIFHGLPFANDKKATSSMSASGNEGPFDNAFGTSPLNAIPTSSQLNADQFIGSDKGTIPNRTSEFNTATGFTIPTMTVGGTTYQQVVWWQYTAADYTKNSNATLRITGPSGTGWDALRLCCPDGNCT